MPLIRPFGRAAIVREPVSLTREQTQALIDGEVLAAKLGLMVWLRCIACRQRGDEGFCDGTATRPEGAPDGVLEFTVMCQCRKRTYRGDDLVAPSPPPDLAERKAPEDGTKPEEPISREDRRLFEDYELALRSLQLQYLLRCRRCMTEDRPSDGVWGLRESTAMQWVLECACTKRIYRGADAPATVH